MTNANHFGFMPGNDAEQNALALQKAVDMGGEIHVCQTGIYDISEPIEIGDDTTLIFEDGVTIRRQESRTGKNGNAFINKGAFSHTRNYNIKLIGLKLICNDVESEGFGITSRYVGLRAQVAFIYITNLEVRNYECTGLLAKDMGIQLGAFENVLLEDLYITGNKDGIHLGWGKNFVIRRARLCTYDDPIALNAYDYSVSNTHVGWIENGLIEDCYDLNAESTTGYFCRLLGGAWGNWYEGMMVHHSDTVVHNGRIYRVVMNPTDSKLYPSFTPPTHEMGVQVYDGINWVCTQEATFCDTGCRNITFRNIHLQKKRGTAFGIDLDMGSYVRSYYPGSHPIPQENLTFENIFVENELIHLIYANYPVQNISLRNVHLGNSDIHFTSYPAEAIEYPEIRVQVANVPGYEEKITVSGRCTVDVSAENKHCE